MPLINYFMMFLACSITAPLLGQTAAHQKVLFNYGDFYPDEITGYDYVVLESAHFSTDDIAQLRETNKTVLAYVSLGEVNESAAHYQDIKEYTLGKNNLWDSHFLDLENEETAAALLDIFELNIEKKGFSGMFLDNIDNYTVYGPTPGRKNALVSFLARVRQRFPKAHFMQNAGLSVLNETQTYVNTLAIESVASAYDFKKQKYKLRKESEFLSLINELDVVHSRYDLPIILIEYANTNKLYQEIKKRLVLKPWPLFIGSIELQSIPQFY